ncbi:hypothetical protein ES708_34556 [subsurface metagenome]
MLGGISIPNVPAPAIEPIIKFRSYPRFSCSGIATEPIVAVVAVLEPERAAKMAHAAIFV